MIHGIIVKLLFLVIVIVFLKLFIAFYTIFIVGLPNKHF